MKRFKKIGYWCTKEFAKYYYFMHYSCCAKWRRSRHIDIICTAFRPTILFPSTLREYSKWMGSIHSTLAFILCSIKLFNIFIVVEEDKFIEILFCRVLFFISVLPCSLLLEQGLYKRKNLHNQWEHWKIRLSKATTSVDRYRICGRLF